jgi:hypothetical protein
VNAAVNVWEFEFSFVPSTPTTRRWATTLPQLRASTAEMAGFWENAAAPVSLVESLDALSPCSSLVNTSQLRWHAENNCFIDVLVDGHRLTNIVVTLDLRAPCLKLVSDLTLLAQRHGWLVAAGDGRIFRPTVRRFIVEIEESQAMRWVRGSIEAFMQRKTAGEVGTMSGRVSRD